MRPIITVSLRSFARLCLWSRARSYSSPAQGMILPAEAQQQKYPADQYRQQAAELQDTRNDDPVFASVGIVVIAKQQNLIDGRPNLAFRCLVQAQPQVARGIRDTVKIARNFALRRQ